MASPAARPWADDVPGEAPYQSVGRVALAERSYRYVLEVERGKRFCALRVQVADPAGWPETMLLVALTEDERCALVRALGGRP